MFDPETGNPTFNCVGCQAWHLGEGCCFNKTPRLTDWMDQNRWPRKDDDEGKG